MGITNFKKRKLTLKITSFLHSPEIVVIHGSRQVGKTTLMKILMDKLINEGIPPENIEYFDLEDFILLELCNKGVKEVIEYLKSKESNANHKRYLCIDEIQHLDNPSSFLKLFHDHYNDKCKLFVSGSSSFNIKRKFKDSLVGRIVDFELFSLDFEEYLEFGDVQIDLHSIKSEAIHVELKKHYLDYIVFGGYPRIALEPEHQKREVYLKQVINTYVRKDIGDLANIRNLQKFNNLLRVLSDQAGSLLNVNELSNTLGLARQTIDEYLFILENTYVIKLLAPFFSNIRSELSKKPKIYFEDTGVMNILRFGTFISKIDGAIFENSIFSILRKNIEMDKIKYWRTTNKQEIDFIIEQYNQLFAIEAKQTYSRQPVAFKAFCSIYEQGKRKRDLKRIVVTLDKKRPPQDLTIQLLYPWELYDFFKNFT